MRNLTRTRSSLMLVGMLLSAVLLRGVQAETHQLNYSIFFPATHGQCQAGMAWAQEIAKRSQGRVEISVHAGGSLTKANQCYDGVVKGISDLGMSVLAYARGRFPAMEALDLPMGYASGQMASLIVNDFYQRFKPQELADVKVLYLHAHGPGLLHTKQPVVKLEDLRQLKIRSTGLSAKVVEALDAVPVVMPQGSTYGALLTGEVDGTFGPMEVLKGWRQAEVINHTTDCVSVGYTATMFVVMNWDRWNSLPPDIQQIIEQVSREWIAVHGRLWDELDREGRVYTLRLGNQIHALSAAESQQWRAAVQPIIAQYIRACQQKGLDGQAYVNAIQALIQKYAKP